MFRKSKFSIARPCLTSFVILFCLFQSAEFFDMLERMQVWKSHLFFPVKPVSFSTLILAYLLTSQSPELLFSPLVGSVCHTEQKCICMQQCVCASGQNLNLSQTMNILVDSVRNVQVDRHWWFNQWRSARWVVQIKIMNTLGTKKNSTWKIRTGIFCPRPYGIYSFHWFPFFFFLSLSLCMSPLCAIQGPLGALSMRTHIKRIKEVGGKGLRRNERLAQR